ncbi:CRISPR-associated protein Csx16 [Gammaproteobacteria bacterium AB-CW1]|uniref:CRISPR-associated protein Csx16 n=1 Tax=Natronospira elongata TaxID=3110268 RepID=A0AAP6MMU3_9GAMM|nr:CRISPR-associated protein Csx16 [Gammaproteobacteria bacterium AB-CW1]
MENKNKRIFLVSRHPGAIRWLQRQGHGPVIHRAHLDLNEIRPGDRVIGTLPVHMAAQVCKIGAEYHHLAVDIPPELRGVELDEQTMAACDARLVPCRVEMDEQTGDHP